ncbi:hypothetical protein BH10BAC3_BH10BAC3_13010 [soil metagenome]
MKFLFNKIITPSLLFIWIVCPNIIRQSAAYLFSHNEISHVNSSSLYPKEISTDTTSQNYFRYTGTIDSADKSKYNKPDSCYLMLNITADNSNLERDAEQVAFKSFEFDKAKATADVKVRR